MEKWPRPPHYEDPQVPAIPAEVFCFGERVEARAERGRRTVAELVAGIRALVEASERCFRALGAVRVEDLRRVHVKLLRRISELERAVLDDAVRAMGAGDA